MNEAMIDAMSAHDYRREAYGDPCPTCGTLRWQADCPQCTEPEPEPEPERSQVGRAFVTAGRAVFTISNPHGTRYTFRVARKRGDDRSPLFVSLLTGPSNVYDYTYLGILNEPTGSVHLTKASRYTDDTIPVKVIRWALAHVWQGKDLPAGYAMHHEGRCGRCGRLLTVPESIETGLGPECASKVF